MAHDVFISYSHSDKVAADATCATLEARHIRCWIAPRDIAPGAEWGESIIDAIGKARVAIVIFSSKADASPQVRREVERAVAQGVTIVPVRVESAEPTRALAYFMAGVHWLDAITPPFETHLDRLATSIKAYLDTVPADAAAPKSEAGPALGLTGVAAAVIAGAPAAATDAPAPSRAETSRGPTPDAGSPPSTAARPPRRPVRRVVRWIGFAVLGLVGLFIGLPLVVYGVQRLFGPPGPTLTIDVPTAAIATVAFGRTSFELGLQTGLDADDLAAGGGDLYTGCSPGAPTSSCTAHLTDYAVRTWDTTGKLLSTFGGKDGPTSDVMWSHQRSGATSMIAVASENKILVWDFQANRAILSVAKGADRVVFSPDDAFLATSNGDIYRLDDGRLAETMSPDCATIADYSPDGSRIVVDHDDSIPTMRVCDVRTGKKLFDLEDADDSSLHHPVFLGADKILVAGRLWDGATGKSLPAFDYGASSSAVSADRRVIATVEPGRIKIWNGTTLAPMKDVSLPRSMTVIALSVDGGWLAVGGTNAIELYDLH